MIPLTGWAYCKSVIINGSADGELTNYQVPVRVYRTTGTDGTEAMGTFTAGKVYVSTKCATDYDDIRFTKADGTTLLDYWIEESDSSDATIWVEVDTIPVSDGTVTIYIHYGKATASAVSNGANTFIFFDDFTGVDHTGWTDPNSIFTVTGGILSGESTRTSTGNVLDQAVSAFTTERMVEGRGKHTSPTAASHDMSIRVSDQRADYHFAIGPANSTDITYRSTGGWATTGVACVLDTYYILGIVVDDASDTADYWIDYTQKITGKAPATGGTHAANTIRLYLYYPGSKASWDWVRVRNYTTNAPTWGDWGAEEVPSMVGCSIALKAQALGVI